MKKTMSMLLAFAVLLGTVGCQVSVDKPKSTTESETTTAPVDQASPTADFDYSVGSDGGITIKKYKGNAEHVVIPETIDGKSVTVIGESAFAEQAGMYSVTLPDTVKVISRAAFLECLYLESIVWSENLETVDVKAFYACTNLAFSALPASLKTIGAEAFSYCNLLTSLTIPAGVTVIGPGAFESSGLASVVLPNGLKTIEYNAFARTSLSAVAIPPSVTAIGSKAFAYCHSLSSVTLHEGLERIGYEAFSNTAIEQIVLPSTLTDITEEAFYGCGALESVTFLGDAPASYLSTEWVNGRMPSYTVFCKPLAEGFTVPYWSGYRTAYVGEEATPLPTHEGLVYFENGEGGITVVDHTECREEVSIPEKINGLPVTRIAASAFRSCAKLKVATLPDSVREIEPHAFSYCNKLTTVNLSQDLKAIGAKAFYYCEKLSDVALPSLLETLGDHAFDLCFGLESIHIPASVKNWGRDVFARTSIDTVTFEDGLETIGKGAFYNTNLTSFCLPQSMKRIEAHAFGNCLLLSSVTLNEGLLSVGKDAFKYDSVLVEIVIPASVSEIYDLTFNCCTNLKRVKFEGDAPDGYVTNDPENAVVGNRYTVYYHADAEGFTAPEWNGYETEIW